MISESFKAFLTEAPQHSKAWMEVVEALAAANGLDPKTTALCYLSVLATARMTGGIPLHAKLARTAGASRAEVISAILVGLPAVGQILVESIRPALQGFDAEG